MMGDVLATGQLRKIFPATGDDGLLLFPPPPFELSFEPHGFLVRAIRKVKAEDHFYRPSASREGVWKCAGLMLGQPSVGVVRDACIQLAIRATEDVYIQGHVLVSDLRDEFR